MENEKMDLQKIQKLLRALQTQDPYVGANIWAEQAAAQDAEMDVPTRIAWRSNPAHDWVREFSRCLWRVRRSIKAG